MRQALLGLLLLLLAVQSHAAVFCAGTTQQLRTALALAQTNGQIDFIRIRSGTFAKRLPSDPVGATAPAFSYASGESLALSGGWSGPNGSCEQQTKDPTLTELEGGYDGLVLSVRVTGANTVVVSNLSVSRGGFGANFPDDPSAAVYLELATGATGALSFENSRVVNSFGRAYEAAVGLAALVFGGDLYLRNNLIAGNLQSHANAYPGGASVRAHSGTVYINGNSFIRNATVSPFIDASSKSVGGLYVERHSALVYLSNNVFEANFTEVLAQQPREHSLSVRSFGAQAGVQLSHNHLGSTQQPDFAPGIISQQVASTVGEPLLGDAPWYQPVAGSILIDSGTTTPPGGLGSLDLLGGPRVSGGSVDRGAIEYRTPLLSDGFESD